MVKQYEEYMSRYGYLFGAVLPDGVPRELEVVG